MDIDSRGFGRKLSAGRRHRSRMLRTVAGLVVLLVLWAGSSAMAQGRRLALVVGNDGYTALSDLQNAVNDARAVASALEDVGFTVETLENATRSQMAGSLGRFAERLRGDDVALLYFAGHGVQVDQANYLIPTDYAGQTAAEVRLSAFSAVEVEDMLRPARVAMLVLDACRDNPYRGFRTSGGGLAPMEARGTLIAYAAGAGEVAADAVAPGSSNGLFTSKLLEALRVPGLTATALFQRVRREVYAASNEAQFPAVYDQLLSDFVFRPSAIGDAGSAGAAAVGARLRQDTVFWESIRNSSNPAEFELYLRQYPAGAFRALASVRLAALRGSATDASAVEPEGQRQALEGLEQGIQLVEEGDYPQAIAELEDASGELEAMGAEPTDIARAHFYLGVALLIEVSDAAAMFAFREAHHQDPTFRPSPEMFPIRVSSLWEQALTAELEPEADAPVNHPQSAVSTIATEGVVFVVAESGTTGTRGTIALGFVTGNVAGEARVVSRLDGFDAGWSRLFVRDYLGTEYPALLVDIDAGSGVAVLGVASRLTAQPYPFARDQVRPGQLVHGATQSDSNLGLQAGHVTGVALDVEMIGGGFIRHNAYMAARQIKGAPLLNNCGQVVGIAISDLDSIGIAFPATWLLERFGAALATVGDRSCAY